MIILSHLPSKATHHHFLPCPFVGIVHKIHHYVTNCPDTTLSPGATVMVPFWKNTATYIPEQSSHWNDIQASQQSGEAERHRCLPIADLKLSLYSHYNSLRFPQCSLSWQRARRRGGPGGGDVIGGAIKLQKMGPKASFSSNKRLWFTSSASETFYVGVTRTWITFIDTYAHLSYSVKLGETIPSPVSRS